MSLDLTLYRLGAIRNSAGLAIKFFSGGGRWWECSTCQPVLAQQAGERRACRVLGQPRATQRYMKRQLDLSLNLPGFKRWG